MKELIINNYLKSVRINEFKQEFEIGNTIDFKWWDLYGRGKATRKIIDKTYEGKPIVRFNGGHWIIEWNEIKTIY
tara:strand:+ start:1428 stop:1652 length:225 start_codon:yes stop_codon:yes gene_type:complete